MIYFARNLDTFVSHFKNQMFAKKYIQGAVQYFPEYVMNEYECPVYVMHKACISYVNLVKHESLIPRNFVITLFLPLRAPTTSPFIPRKGA